MLVGAGIMRISTKKGRIDWCLCILMIFIIFMTDTSYLTINASTRIADAAGLLIILVSIGWIVRDCLIKRKQVKRMLIFLTMSICCTIILTESLFGLSYYMFIFEIWFCYLFAKAYSIEEFSHYYLSVMRIVAIGSLVCWLFPRFFVQLSFFPKFTSSVGAEYRFLGLTTIPFKTHMQRRNFGPFWEPGTYQVYLCMAIFLLLFVEDKKNKTFDLVLFIITELTTMSGASLLPAGLMLAAYLLKERKLKSFFAVLIGSAVIMLLIDTGLFDGIFLKMTGQDSNSSFMIRWIGFEGGIRAFLAHPLFGASFAEIKQIKDELGLKYLGIYYGSNTSTFANYLAYYGLFVGMFFFASSYRFFKKICGKGIVGLIAFTAYFLSTSNENLIGSLLIITAALLGFCGELQPQVQIKEGQVHE